MFYEPAGRVIGEVIAGAIEPKAPPDITQWCIDNIEFDERSPLAGPFDIDRFPFLREVHECLSPEHPCREITLRGSAQFCKTVSVINPAVATWLDYEPCDVLVVHPTTSSANEWARNKWGPLRRQAPALRRLFPGNNDLTDTLSDQEAFDRSRTLKIASAGSPDDLSGTSRRYVVMDDLSKFENLPEGDPEEMSISRASAYDEAKILRVSTPQIVGTCRVTKAIERSDDRHYHVPCPSCGVKQPLTWENFKATIDPENLAAAHFTCVSCQSKITNGDRERIMPQGIWIPQNPKGDHPGFSIWRAYSPLRDLHSIAVDYARVMGWSSAGVSLETAQKSSEEVDAKTEQTFHNDVLGRGYEQATGAPKWSILRDRAEEGEGYERGQIPVPGIIFALGVDCQDDRTEVHFIAFGQHLKSWSVDYRVIPHKIDEKECWDALDSFLKEEWTLPSGQKIRPDILAIDEGNWQTDVRDWAKRHPRSRVITVRGQKSAMGPTLTPMRLRKKKDGTPNKRVSKGSFMVNVSQLKADFYGNLAVEDPVARGFCGHPRGMGDEYFRQMTSEKREITRAASGATDIRWVLVDPKIRNEVLDTRIYAMAGAVRKGWQSLSFEQWVALAEAQSVVPEENQGELFERVVPHTPDPDAKPDADEAARERARLLGRM